MLLAAVSVAAGARAAPQSTAPETGPAMPAPAKPDPATPAPAKPSPATPATANPGSAKPDPATPAPAPAMPATATPGSAKADPPKAGPVSASPPKPGPAKPGPAKPSPAKPSPAKPGAAKPSASVAPATVTLCAALEAAARRNGLPFPFFTRLIWQESRFDPTARSPAGAEGVAQFMPATAAERGLADPFEPARALDESAAYLKELRAQFGNLGLAAAAYNAGPGRLTRWIAGSAGLPSETIDYVRIVTGHAVLEWRDPEPPVLAPEPGFSCTAFAGRAGRVPLPSAAEEPGAPPLKPWAVILVGSFNKAAVTAEYALVRAKYADTLGALTPSVRRRRFGGTPARKYVVQIEENDRSAGDKLCKRLESAGGNCVVLRNILR